MYFSHPYIVRPQSMKSTTNVGIVATNKMGAITFLAQSYKWFDRGIQTSGKVSSVHLAVNAVSVFKY